MMTPTPTEVLDLAKLAVNPAYQRAISEAQVREIAQNFVPAACSDPLVVRYPSEMKMPDEIADGQTRVAAMLALGITEWRCRIAYASDAADAADLFFAANVLTRPLKAPEIHKAASKAGRPCAQVIDRTVVAHGFTLIRPNRVPVGEFNEQGLAYIGAVSAIYGLADSRLFQYEEPSAESLNALGQVLDVTRLAWGARSTKVRTGWVGNRFLRGLGALLAKFDYSVDVEAVASALKTTRPLRLEKQATLYTDCVGGTNSETPWMRAIFDHVCDEDRTTFPYDPWGNE